MSGLEYIMRRAIGSSAPDSSKDEPPTDLEGAMKQVSNYIQSNLPTVIEIEMIPMCFDLIEDETKVILGGKQGNVAIYDIEAQKIMSDIELCSCAITSTSFVLDYTAVIVTNQVMSMYVLQYPSLSTLCSLPLGIERLDVRIGLNKESFIVANCTEVVMIYDLTCFKEENLIINPLLPTEINDNLEGHSKILTRKLEMGSVAACLDISEDGSLLGFGLANGTVKLYHGESESELQSTHSLESPIEKICFSQHRKLLAVVTNKNKVVVMSIGAVFNIKHTNEYHKTSVTALAFVRDDRYLITGGEDSLIIMHDMKVERSPYFLELFDYSVLWFKPSKDHRKLYYCQHTNKIMIWQAPVLSKNARYRKHTKKVNAVVFIPDSFELMSISEDGLAIIWDCRNDQAQEVLEAGNPLTLAIVSKTSKFVMIATDRPSIIRWNLCTYKSYETEIGTKIKCIRLSPDEQFLAVGDEACRIVVFNVVDMSKKAIVKGHTQEVTEAYFIKDNMGILSSSRDSTVTHWNLETLEKVKSFYGHTKPVTCMLVSFDEKIVVTGSEDYTVNIWSIIGILMHTLHQQSTTQGLYITKDNKYLVTIETSQLNFWQLDNLTLTFQRDLNSAQCVRFSYDDKSIAIAQGNTIFVEENPLIADNVRVTGKSRGSSHKFMNYILQIFNDNIRSEYLDMYSQWIFTPYVIGIAHILAYKNKYDILHRALVETENKASFCYTIKDETPLSISVEMDHKTCIEICLKYLKKDFTNKNKLAYVPLGKCLTQLNLLDISSIPKLYEMLFVRDESIHLPNYCVDGALLPKIFYSDYHLIDVETLLPKDSVSTHGQSIVFYHSLCPLDIDVGTVGSINFLESLLDCNYSEIFRSKFIQVLLRDKWDKIKWSIYAQGFLYIIYLVQLSFYCILFIDSFSYLIVLFLVHVLLFLYEVIQIATDKYDYWKDVWNILDQLRGISFSLYAVLFWYGDTNQLVLLIVIIFSWTRGISYFRMFEGTRYMVRLLSEVIKDMQVFFIILFYSTLAFAFILYLNDPKFTFGEYVTISYRLDLGDFGGDYKGVFDWIIFFLATVINPLIMLNLLISIMSDTYSKVQETNDIANYQELTEMIIEIEKLMFWKRSLCQRYYLQQCDYLKGYEQSGNKLIEKIKSMKVQINLIQSEVHLCYEEIKKNNELTQSVLSQNQQMISMLMQKFDLDSLS